MSPHRSVYALAAALGFVVAGCGERKPAVAVAPSPSATSETTITSAEVPTTPVSPSISVSDIIARTCRLDIEEIAQAPKFEFDRSELLQADYDVLERIAYCVTRGPLEGRKLLLVGRADPRGPNEYNMALGARRANNVGAYLGELGLEVGRIRETSRGELDATGTNEATWQIDRRVDILLAE